MEIYEHLFDVLLKHTYTQQMTVCLCIYVHAPLQTWRDSAAYAKLLCGGVRTHSILILTLTQHDTTQNNTPQPLT